MGPLVYPNTDVFLLCFSVVMPSTFQNVREKWIPEIRSQSKKVPIVLVGTQSDLRADAKTLVGLRHSKEHPIQESEARKHNGRHVSTTITAPTTAKNIPAEPSLS